MPKALTDKEWYERFPDLVKGQTGIRCMGKSLFLCKTHGQFSMTPDKRSHQGCRLCAIDRSKASGIVSKKHRKKYPGIKLGQPWLGASKKHLFECKTHGDVESHPSSIKSGQGFCRFCMKSARIVSLGSTITQELANKYPGIKLGLPWMGASNKNIFECNVHGDVESIPANVQNGSGFCLQCYVESRLPLIHIEPLPIPAVVQHLTALGVTPQYRFLVLATIIPVA